MSPSPPEVRARSVRTHRSEVETYAYLRERHKDGKYRTARLEWEPIDPRAGDPTTVNTLRTVALILATVSTGLTAGVFGLYAHTVMPGLATTDDRTFVASFQAMDRAILNLWFLGLGFMGALIASVVAAATQIGHDTVPWVVAALVLYLVAFVITFVVHLPLNDALKAAGDPDSIANLDAVRRDFDEARWRTWNTVRAWTSTSAFALLCWSLFVHGRSLP